MGTAMGFQSKILGFTFLIAPPRGVRQVVNGVPISSDQVKSWIKRPHMLDSFAPQYGSCRA